MSRNVSVYNTDGLMMERTNDQIWRPMPYIATSINGALTDISAQFIDFTQLPATGDARLQQDRAVHLTPRNCVTSFRKVASAMLPSRSWRRTSTSQS